MKITVKEFGIRMLMVLLSVALAVVLIEAVLQTLKVQRLRLWQSSSIFKLDEDLIYSLKPRHAREWSTDEFKEFAKINSQGLRNDEIADYGRFDKRIIALGDSFTYGHGVSAEESYPSQLEKIFLQEDGLKIDVINAGVPGYNSDQEYKFYKTRLSRIPHDILILGLNANDVGENIDHPLYTIRDGRLAPLDARRNWIYRIGTFFMGAPDFVRKSTLVNYIILRLRDGRLFSQIPQMAGDQGIAWSRKKILLQIQDLREICMQNHVEFVVALMPGKGVSERDYQWFLDASRGEDITVLNLPEDPVWEKRGAEIFFVKDPHLNPEGNRVLAERIHEGLRK